MQDIATKGTGDSLTAAEWNQVPDELENAIEDTGQVLSGADLTQVSKAMATYAAGGAFYTDSGAADAYVLSTVGSKRAPTAYFDGLAVMFRAGNANTNVSTVNVAGLGVKVLRRDNVGLVKGDIITTDITTAVYNNSTGAFDITGKPVVGSVVQVANVTDGAVATGTTVIPGDDTIPQITEGDEYMTLAFTPTKATNKLQVEVITNLSHSSTTPGLITALFQDATADALAVCVSGSGAVSNSITNGKLTHHMTSGTTSATTFRVRCGNASAGTTTFNGSAAARLFGGAFSSSITITEIEV